MAESDRAPLWEQLPLWDWPIEAEAGPAEPRPPRQPIVRRPASIPHVSVAEREPAVAEALGVVSRSLAEMAATETRPLLDEPPRRHRLRPFGDTDLSVFPIALGGATFGWTASPESTMRILDGYAEAGGNFLDTADRYAAGRSEMLIGNWLKDRGNRDRIVLSTKIGRGAEFPGLSAQNILRAAEASLRRLQVEHVDLLHFALDDLEVPLEESLTAADALLRAGKVRHVAASGFSPERLMEARVTAGQLLLPRFAGIQAHYSLLTREGFERSLLPVAQAQGLAVVPYLALESGFLTGKYRSRGRDSKASDAHSRSKHVEQHRTKKGFRVLAVLEDVAAQQGVSPATTALAWLLTKPLVTAPVVSASRPEQVRDLVQAATVHLTRAQVAALDRATAY
ncbi:MAG TPA: aldo/keto reductase [Naasia sp.]